MFVKGEVQRLKEQEKKSAQVLMVFFLK